MAVKSGKIANQAEVISLFIQHFGEYGDIGDDETYLEDVVPDSAIENYIAEFGEGPTFYDPSPDQQPLFREALVRRASPQDRTPSLVALSLRIAEPSIEGSKFLYA